MNLKELSENLGLSPTTVSRALNGYPEVSEMTRQRVIAAAQQHNYLPNARAKGLAMGRAHAIGHVIPIAEQHEMLNPIFMDFIAGAGETYSAAGYEMVLNLVPKDKEVETYQSLHSRGAVDGVILHAPTMQDDRLDLLNDLEMPFAVHGRVSDKDSPYSYVDVNNRRAFTRATDFLLDLGHRRIALINGQESMDFALRRRQGFERALAERGIAVDPDLMSADDMTEDYGYRQARRMLDREDAPTAFLVSSILPAMGVRRAVEELGLTLGREVSVVTYDDVLSFLTNGSGIPIFTATRSSVREAGRRLAQILIDQINHPDAPKQQVLLEAELTVGQSTGPAP